MTIHLKSEFFEICAELREAIDDRKEWHQDGHKKDCKNPHCRADPLYHLIVSLNKDLASKKQECLKDGIEESDLIRMLSFFKLS